MTQTIQAWSPSLLQVFEECRYRAFLRAVKKIPEPERPPLPNGKEYPNDRGSRIHDEAEGFVRGTNAMTRALMPFAEDFMALKDIFDDGDAILEDLWCFDEDWELVPKVDGKHQWWKHWARIKIDFLGFLEPHRALVIDYKTGKKIGNEIKHGDQVFIYAVATLMLYPEVEEVTVELWYLDQDEITQKTYTRTKVMRFLRSLERRALNITTTTDFTPDPSTRNCKFCPYKTGMVGRQFEGTGHCSENLKVEK